MKRRGAARRHEALQNIEPITMDVKEAAAYLGVSEPTVYADIKARKLPVVRIRGRILIVRELLHQMVIDQARENWDI